VAILFILLAGLSPMTAWAHGATPTQVVENFHKALVAGDGEAALALLLPDATIYEQGASQTKEEYASHHLAADMAFASAVEREVVDQSKKEVGDVTWITTRTHTTGTYKDKTIDSRGVETVVLQHVKEGWRIAHVHWSSGSK
jgi:ketosteroid isomerase-like protein